MANEIELKLRLPASCETEFLRHPLLARARALPSQKLQNTYYDTPERRLLEERTSLRIRKRGSKRLVTVKSAAPSAGGLSVRPEWEFPFEGSLDFTPITEESVRKLLANLAASGALQPAFQTTFTRRSWRFRPSPETSLLLALDEGSISANDQSEPISEVELELESGPLEALFQVALELVRDLPLRPMAESKAERGYRLCGALPLEPAKAKLSAAASGDTPWQAFCRIAADCMEQFERNEAGLGLHPEFVHQMRVALRRLRAAVRLFAPVLPASFAEAFQPPLRQLARLLGAGRDLDVFSEDTLAPALQAHAGHAGLGRVAELVDERRRSARDAIRTALAGREHAEFSLRLAMAIHGEGGSADRGLRKFAAKRLAKLNRSLRRTAKEVDSQDLSSRHALRIRCKRLRYGMEFFQPLWGETEGREALDRLKDAQDILGRVNDCAYADRLLAQLAAEHPDLADAAALLRESNERRRVEWLDAAAAHLKKLRKLDAPWEG